MKRKSKLLPRDHFSEVTMVFDIDETLVKCIADADQQKYEVF